MAENVRKIVLKKNVQKKNVFVRKQKVVRMVGWFLDGMEWMGETNKTLIQKNRGPFYCFLTSGLKQKRRERGKKKERMVYERNTLAVKWKYSANTLYITPLLLLGWAVDAVLCKQAHLHQGGGKAKAVRAPDQRIVCDKQAVGQPRCCVEERGLCVCVC